jgi:hypothetical protein
MEARRVHTIMASGLSNPSRLHSWTTHPDTLRAMHVGLETNSAASAFAIGLWKFAGLGEKIRHTNCRSDIPSTFRLLASTGLEIDVFSSLTQQAGVLRKQGRKGSLEKIANLIDFLRDWHDPENRNHVLLWDLIRHESAIAELTQAIPTSLVEPTLAQLSADSVPRLRGTLRLHRMRFDPRSIIAEMRKQAPDPGSIDPSPVCLGYWLNPQGQLLVIDLDDFTLDLLIYTNGVRSVQVIAMEFAKIGAQVPVNILISVLHRLQKYQIIGV